MLALLPVCTYHVGDSPRTAMPLTAEEMHALTGLAARVSNACATIGMEDKITILFGDDERMPLTIVCGTPPESEFRIGTVREGVGGRIHVLLRAAQRTLGSADTGPADQYAEYTDADELLERIVSVFRSSTQGRTRSNDRINLSSD